MSHSFHTRLGALRRQLEGRRLDGLVVSHMPNIRYLCGFTGSAGALLVRSDTALLVTDGRYRTQAMEEIAACRLRIERGDALTRAGRALEGRKALRMGFEAARVSAADLRMLRLEGPKNVSWSGTMGLVEALRIEKDPGEIEAIRASARLASGVLDTILAGLKPGVAELEVAAEIDYQMRIRGAERPAFETIVASGPRTALPHAHPTSRRLEKNELVLLDWGAILRGYCSDLTRTVYLGNAPPRVRKWYGAVLEAQKAAIERVREGVAGEEVDRAARQTLGRSRLGRYFTHSTGHGLGLEVHEEPRLARGQTRKLATGNVVTVEPGIYVEGTGGIRIEDDVLITQSGPEVLTEAPREFLQI